MAILLVIMIGVLSSVAFAYTSSNETEMRNIATNVASYTLEYLRARTITRGTLPSVLGALGIPLPSVTPVPSTGTYGWYDATTNPTGAFPSMIDVNNLPVQSDGYPCNYTSAGVTSGTIVDAATGNNKNASGTSLIGAGGQPIHFASKHAVLPTDTYGPLLSTTSLAWSTTLQGYVSVMNTTPPGTQESFGADEDKNVARMVFSSTNMYRTLLMNAWSGLMVQYPGVYLAAPPALVITSFTPLAGYVPQVYTTDATGTGKVKTTTPNPTYNPYYTNAQTGTQLYRGFRVLTQIVARSAAAANPITGFRQVQYYDVTVTVLWMSGTHESNYQLVSQIVAY